ncbi:kelch repeat protein [Gigaspora margarita]|nr:kelch repeat protein [Gigaspora margarita]
MSHPFIGGNSNKKLFFIDQSLDVLYVDTFNTKLNKWEANNSYNGLPNTKFLLFDSWVFNETTGISYSFQGLNIGVVMFDTINFAWINSISNPQNLFPRSSFLSKCIPVLLSNCQILYIGGEFSNIHKYQILMDRILTYDSIKDSWQFNNTTGKTPEWRKYHTVVLTSDGRIIVYGGQNNLSMPATPSLTVLDTSKIPFEWSTPTEENSIGRLIHHTSVMVKNYMITAFGTNVSEKGDDLDNYNIYKLDTSNLSNYKWSLLSNYTLQSISPFPNTTIKPNSEVNNASFNE